MLVCCMPPRATFVCEMDSHINGLTYIHTTGLCQKNSIFFLKLETWLATQSTRMHPAHSKLASHITLHRVQSVVLLALSTATLGRKYWGCRISHFRVCFFCNRLQEKNLDVALLNSSKCFGKCINKTY